MKYTQGVCVIHWEHYRDYVLSARKGFEMRVLQRLIFFLVCHSPPPSAGRRARARGPAASPGLRVWTTGVLRLAFPHSRISTGIVRQINQAIRTEYKLEDASVCNSSYTVTVKVAGHSRQCWTTLLLKEGAATQDDTAVCCVCLSLSPSLSLAVSLSLWPTDAVTYPRLAVHRHRVTLRPGYTQGRSKTLNLCA